MWIAVELTTLLSAFLVGYEDTAEALEAAWKYVVLTTLGAILALLGFLILYWATAHRGRRPVHLGRAGRGRAAACRRRCCGRLPADPGRVRHQGRARADAHLAARRPQPGAGLDLRAALRRRDHDRALRRSSGCSRRSRPPGSRTRAAGSSCFGLISVGRRRAAPDPCARLQAHVRLLDGRAHGDHPGRGRARRRRSASWRRLSDHRPCAREVLLLLCGRHRRCWRSAPRRSRPCAA